MYSFDHIVNTIIDLEGGFVHDPDDPGGATNMGITIGLMQAMSLDVDGDGDVDIHDVKDLPRDRAKTVYYEQYWQPAKVDAVPNALREVYFSMAINMGIKPAVRVLQRAVNGKLGRDELNVDGVMGPKTINALISHRPGVRRVVAYMVLRYADIVFANPRLEKFWLGWFNRALSHLEAGHG